MKQPPPYVREILAYLADHPDAQDSLDGILEWWVLERLISLHRGEIRLAVQELVERGILEENQRPGSPALYRLNPKQREHMSHWLQGTPESEES